MLGVLAAIIVRDEKARAIVMRRSAVLWTLALGLFVLVGYMARRNWMIESTQMVTWGFTAIALFYGVLLLLAVTRNDSLLSRALRLTPLRRLGGIAYGVYLLHVPVQSLLYAYIQNSLPRLRSAQDAAITLTALFLTLTLATLSWRFFERPLVQVSHRLTY